MSFLRKDDFNFIPKEYLEKEKLRRQKRMVKILLPILLVMLILPVFLLFTANNKTQQEIDRLYGEQAILVKEMQKMEIVELRMAEIENRISVFSDLMSNSYKRVVNIKNIESYIPSQITYTKISLVFSDYLEANLEKKEEEIEVPEVMIFRKIPNIMLIEGKTRSLDAISKFVYNLNRDPMIEIVNMEEIGWLEEEKINSFRIIIEIKEDNLS